MSLKTCILTLEEEGEEEEEEERRKKKCNLFYGISHNEGQIGFHLFQSSTLHTAAGVVLLKFMIMKFHPQIC